MSANNNKNEKRIVSDDSRVGTTRHDSNGRSPSRRNDDDDDDALRPPSAARLQYDSTKQETSNALNDGPHFYPDTATRAATRENVSLVSTPANQSNDGQPSFSSTISCVVQEDMNDGDAERTFATRATQSGACDAVPGVLSSLSSFKPSPQRSLKGSANAELPPPESLSPYPVPLDGSGKPHAKSHVKEVQDCMEGDAVDKQTTVVDVSSVDDVGGARRVGSEHDEGRTRPMFQPRPPNDEIIIGAIREPGIDGTFGSDDLNDELTEVMPSGRMEVSHSGLPVARIADETNQDQLEDLGQAEPISDDDLKGKGAMGWIRRHKCCAAIAVLIVLVAIIGGVVGSTVSVNSPSSLAPTLVPTLSPSAAPTLVDFELIADALTAITPYSTLTDPTTPQSAAVAWLLRDDDYANVSDTPKLLQRYALATIYYATVGHNWTRQLEFLNDQDECLWTAVVDNVTFGVRECNDDGLATKLALSRNGLQGALPEEIRALSMLVEFEAAINNMNGIIPAGISALTDLTDIYLHECGLSGTLPQGMGNLRKLTHLALQGNDLSGTLPAPLYDLTSLDNLYLSQNRLSGTILTNIGNLVSLEQLWLNTNRFTGVVPNEVSRMTSLEYIHLEENEFTGGMENFCTASIDLISFRSDCFADGIFEQEPEVECFCFTECCSQDSFEGCVPNQLLP